MFLHPFVHVSLLTWIIPLSCRSLPFYVSRGVLIIISKWNGGRYMLKRNLPLHLKVVPLSLPWIESFSSGVLLCQYIPNQIELRAVGYVERYFPRESADEWVRRAKYITYKGSSTLSSHINTFMHSIVAYISIEPTILASNRWFLPSWHSAHIFWHPECRLTDKRLFMIHLTPIKIYCLPYFMYLLM